MSALQLYPYQVGILDKLRAGFANGHRSQMLVAPTGGGKCLGRDTPVMMADGTIKAVQNIITGDMLMGDDGTPRNVLSIATGRESLYRVTPKKGASYVVNASHLLSLRLTSGSAGINLADGVRISKTSEVIAVRADVFYSSNKTAKHCLKGWRAGVIESFYRDDESEDRLMPAYLLGAWLGDGSIGHASITKPPCRMVDEWIAYGARFGYGVHTSPGKKCPTWRITKGRDGSKFNLIQSGLECMGVLRRKHIPDAYKYGPINDRLEMLAGLIDSDGHVSRNGCDWISKSEELAKDFAFVCRSVGLSCYLTFVKKRIKSTGFEGWYWRASVSGDLSIIPTRDKPFSVRLQKKRHLVHGITLEPIGDGDYFGFEIDGNKLFLLGDFTVTHNTEMAIALLQAASEKGNRSAMLLDRVVLCNQTSARLQKYGIDHGVMQSGHWRYRPSEQIQVCSAQTLEKRGSFPGLKVLIVDEAHQTRKQTIAFIKANPDVKVIGLSATPFSKGLGSIYTNVVSSVTTSELIGLGKLAPLKVFISKEIDMTGAKKVAGEWSQDEVTTRGMKITGDIVAEWVKKTHQVFGGPRKTVVFCSGVAHGADLCQQFSEAGYNFISLSYKDDDQYKADAIEEFSKPNSNIHGLIATDILTKGFDVSDVMIGVSARPFSKSLSSHVQQMGRVMRSHPGKEFALWLDHSGNYLRFKDDWDDVFSNGVTELDDGREKTKKEPTAKEKKAAKCPKCGHLWTAFSDVCSMCGYVREKRSEVTSIPGEMVELSKISKNLEKHNATFKSDFYAQLLGYCKERNYKPGWAWHAYGDRFKVGPSMAKPAAKTPGAEVRAWLISRQIRQAKSRGVQA